MRAHLKDMCPHPRLSSRARRTTFAEKGFDRTPTRELARAPTWARSFDAGVRAAARAGELDGPPAAGGLHG